ncbi:ZN347-like protein, partial [Mya arenaria]
CHVHSEAKPFVCINCEKSFPTIADLHNHNIIRLEKSREKSNLKAHLDMHKGESSLKCPECEKVFRHRSSLSRHNKIHKNNMN